jgi:hypothetical protein
LAIGQQRREIGLDLAHQRHLPIAAGQRRKRVVHLVHHIASLDRFDGQLQFVGFRSG